MQNWATRAFRLLASATLAFGSAEAALSLSIHYGSDTQRVVDRIRQRDHLSV